MRMLCHETYKITGQSYITVAFCIIVLLNIVIMFINVHSKSLYMNISPNDYKKFHEKFASATPFDILKFIEQNDEFDYFISSNDDIAFVNFTNYYLHNRIKTELINTLNYDDYLNGIDEATHKITSFNLLVNVDSFSYRNAKKTASDFNEMKGTELVFAPSLGIILTTDDLHTDFFALFIIIVMSMILFFYEKDNNLFNLSRTTFNGGKRHAVCKLFTLWFFCFIIILFLYFPKLKISETIFGLGDLSRPLQSVLVYHIPNN